MIDLYGMTSPNVRKIFFMLEELELPYRFHHIKVLHGDQFKPKFRRMNPNGKVPVIVDSEGPDGKPFTVFESGVILTYLAEKHGRFYPSAPVARYEVMQWLMLQMASVGPMLGQLNHFQMAGLAGNEYAMRRYTNEARRLYDLLEERLSSSPFLAGTDYSIADIATQPWTLYYERHGFDWTQRPHLQRWRDGISARPAIQRAQQRIAQIEIDDAATVSTADAKVVDRFYNRHDAA